MSDLELRIAELEGRVGGLEDRMDVADERHELLKGLPGAVSELTGAVNVLRQFMVERLDTVQTGVDKFSSVKTAILFAGTVIVPVVVALIGAYFLLRSGGAVGGGQTR